MVLLDLDGTITDPRHGITASYQFALRAVGIDPPPVEELLWVIGPSIWDVAPRFGITDPDVAERFVSTYRDRHSSDGLHEYDPIPGMPEMVADLDADGRTIALATAKPLLQAGATLEHLGLRDHVDALGCASLDRSRTHKTDIVAALLVDLGHPEPASVVMVGDRATDVQAGRHHGLATIGVSWGFASPGELEAAGPDLLASSVPDLRAALGLPPRPG